MFLQKHSRLLYIATKEQGSHNRGGHHFCIAHLALFVFAMVQSFQNIVTNTIYGYNLTVHGVPPLRLFGVVTTTLADTPWIPKGSNLSYILVEVSNPYCVASSSSRISTSSKY